MAKCNVHFIKVTLGLFNKSHLCLFNTTNLSCDIFFGSEKHSSGVKFKKRLVYAPNPLGGTKK